MPQSSTRLERYELLDRIAVGGMAEVFRAVASGAHGFEKTLAIKRILPDLARDPEFEQRFINEAKLAVKLSHANVVQVFDFGRFAGSLFIAMEYVDGLDLAALLRASKSSGERVPVPPALYIAIEMARGLDFAHGRKVIHRDVSPSNILLSRAGEVKIADFGIAEASKRRGPSAGGARRIMGKWRYMSPEQARGGPVTTASDVFSSAAVIFELVTGDKLFPGTEADEIIENIETMPIPSVTDRRPGIPERLDAILARALERDPAARPVAAEVLSELLELSYESTIVASPLGVAEAVEGIIGARSRDDSSEQLDLDQLIRAQLADADGRATTIRKTAVGEPEADDAADEDQVTGQAVVTRGVDADGITVLELDEDTLAAGPVAMRTGRRSTAPPVGAEGDDSDGSGLVRETSLASQPPRGRGSLVVAAAAAAALVAGGAVWWSQSSGRDRPVKLPVPELGDAGGSRPAQGRLTVKSVPPGAQIFLDGVLYPEPTPASIAVSADEPHILELRAEGYEPWTEEGISLEPGENLATFHRLEPLRAQLRVVTSPAGAAVILDGERLGETPLFVGDLAPGTGRRLRLEKPEHKPIALAIDLVAGEPLAIEQTLTRSVRYGRIQIEVIKDDEYGGWAYVYFNEAIVKDPRDPDAKGLATPATYRLPVGKQRIRLYNPVTRRSKWATVTVPEKGVGAARLSLAP